MQGPWGRNLILMQLPTLVEGVSTRWSITVVNWVTLVVQNFSSVASVSLSIK